MNRNQVNKFIADNIMGTEADYFTNLEDAWSVLKAMRGMTKQKRSAFTRFLEAETKKYNNGKVISFPEALFTLCELMPRHICQASVKAMKSKKLPLNA